MVFNQIRRLFITLDATDKATRKLKQVDQTADNMSRTVAEASERLRFLRRRLVAAGFGATVLIGAITQMVQHFAQVDRIFARVAATSGATAEQMSKIREEARRIGAQMPVRLREAAKAFQQLSYAGFSVQEQLAAANSVTELAVAGGMKMSEAARVAASTLRAYSLEAQQVGQVTNALAATFTNSATNLNELRDGLQYVQSSASAVGQSVNESVAALGTLADVGLRASKAGTALERMFVKLAEQTGVTKEAMNRLGLSLEDFTNAQGDFKDLNDIVQILSNSMSDLEGNAAELRAMQQMFGARGARAAVQLVRNQEKLITKIGNNARAQIEAIFRTLDQKTQEELDRMSSSLGFQITPQTNTEQIVNNLKQQVRDGASQADIQTRLQVGLGLEEQTAQIFARDLMTESADDIARSLNGITTAGDIASEVMASLGGQIDYLLGSLDTLNAKIVTGMMPVLNVFFALAKGLLDTLNNSPKVIKAMGAALGALAATLTLLTVQYAAAAAKTWVFIQAQNGNIGAMILTNSAIMTQNALLAIYQGNVSMAALETWFYNSALYGMMTAAYSAATGVWALNAAIEWFESMSVVGQIISIVVGLVLLTGTLMKTASAMEEMGGPGEALIKTFDALGQAINWFLTPVYMLVDALGWLTRLLIQITTIGAEVAFAGFAEAAEGLLDVIRMIPVVGEPTANFLVKTGALVDELTDLFKILGIAILFVINPWVGLGAAIVFVLDEMGYLNTIVSEAVTLWNQLGLAIGNAIRDGMVLWERIMVRVNAGMEVLRNNIKFVAAGFLAAIGPIGWIAGALYLLWQNWGQVVDMTERFVGTVQSLFPKTTEYVMFAINAFVMLGETVWNTMKSIGDIIVTSGQIIIDIIQIAGKAVTALGIIMGGLLYEGLQVAGDAIAWLGKQISQFFAPYVEQAKQKINELVEFLEPYLSVAIDGAVLAMKALAAGFLWAVDGGRQLIDILGAIVASTVGTVARITNVFAGFFEWMFGGIADVLNWWEQATGKIADMTVMEMVNAMLSAGGALIDTLVKGIKGAIPNLGNIMHDVASFIRDFLPFSPAKRGPLSDLPQAGKALVKTLGAGIQSAVGLVKAPVKAVMGAIKGAIDGAGQIANAAIDLGSQIAGGIADGIKGAAGTIAGAAKGALDTATGAVGAAGDVVGGVGNAIGNAVGSGVGAAGDAVSAVGGAVGGAADMAGDVGGAIGGAVSSGVGGLMGGGGGKKVEQRNQNQIIFQGEVHDAQKVAEQVQEGMDGAIEEAQGAVEDSMDMASDVVDEGTDILGL